MSTDTEPKTGHARIETNNFLMILLILLVIGVGGMVEIVPLYFQKSTTQPVAGLLPYTPLQLAGRDIYIREGCYGCHSQMIRPLRAETLRYGHYSVAGEFVYDHPFQWGSKRTGPDLHRVGGKYSDDWQRLPWRSRHRCRARRRCAAPSCAARRRQGRAGPSPARGRRACSTRAPGRAD